MKPFTKGLLLGVFVTMSCVGFMANKNKPEIGRYLPFGNSGLSIVDTVTGDVIITISEDDSRIAGQIERDEYFRHRFAIDMTLK